MSRNHIFSLVGIVGVFFGLSSCQSGSEQKAASSASSPKATATEMITGETGMKLDSTLTPYLEELRKLTDNNAALAVGITKGDEIIYARVFGQANVSQGVDANLSTQYHIASLSKPFVAAAILKLAEEGKLTLEDLLVDHIPTFKMQGEGADQITLKHMLTHTSGIPRHVKADDWIDPSFGPTAIEENIEHAQQYELQFSPGTAYNYSNAAFDILGVVVSRASGMPFHEYVTAHVLQPAGMTSSAYTKPEDKAASFAAAHSYGVNTMELEPYPYNERVFPSSGLLTTLPDLCRWGIIHLGKGSHKESTVLSEASFQQLVSPHFETPWGDQIGLSWFLQSYMDRPIIMHTGFDTGFEAMMYIYPEDKVTIVVLANRDFARTGRIINAASEFLFGQQANSYQVSARYPFAKEYVQHGLEGAMTVWESLRTDTSGRYYVNDEDLLTMGALLENSRDWNQAKELLETYLSFDNQSTYGWRLLGNTHLNLGDTASAQVCYEQTLRINPNYEKGQRALRELLKVTK